MAIFLAHPAPRTDPRNLAQRALADILPFTHEDQQAIRAGATRLAKGQAPAGLPPRHLVSAAAYALTSGRVVPRVPSRLGDYARIARLVGALTPTAAHHPARRSGRQVGLLPPVRLRHHRGQVSSHS
jgi:hypothetical protein